MTPAHIRALAPIAEFTRWIPTGDSNGSYKHGLELVGSGLAPEAVGDRIRTLDRTALEGAAFVVIPLTAISQLDVSVAVASISRVTLKPRMCLLINHAALSSEATASAPEGVGFMLNIEDGSTPLSALTNEALEAVRLDADYAKSLSRTIRGAQLLDSLVHFAQNVGLAILGPYLQESENDFGLPVCFDYVAEKTMVDVLSKHRLR